MHGEQLGRFGIELHTLERADIYLREVALVEARLQHLSIHENALFLEFFLIAEHILCRVELGILTADGLRLLVALRLQIGRASCRERV